MNAVRSKLTVAHKNLKTAASKRHVVTRVIAALKVTRTVSAMDAHAPRKGAVVKRRDVVKKMLIAARKELINA